MKQQTGGRRANWMGMNWINKWKRLAIYMRDGFQCCYCGRGIAIETDDADESIRLTLDHLTPVNGEKPNNHETNLITCCDDCNKMRGTAPWQEFATAAAEVQGIDPQDLINHILHLTRQSLPIRVAKQILETRKWHEAIASAAKVG